MYANKAPTRAPHCPSGEKASSHVILQGNLILQQSLSLLSVSLQNKSFWWFLKLDQDLVRTASTWLTSFFLAFSFHVWWQSLSIGSRLVSPFKMMMIDFKDAVNLATNKDLWRNFSSISILRSPSALWLLWQPHKIGITERSSRCFYVCSYTHIQKPEGQLILTLKSILQREIRYIWSLLH